MEIIKAFLDVFLQSFAASRCFLSSSRLSRDRTHPQNYPSCNRRWSGGNRICTAEPTKIGRMPMSCRPCGLIPTPGADPLRNKPPGSKSLVGKWNLDHPVELARGVITCQDRSSLLPTVQASHMASLGQLQEGKPLGKRIGQWQKMPDAQMIVS